MRYLELSGTDFEIGYQQGEALKDVHQWSLTSDESFLTSSRLITSPSEGER